MKAVTDRECLEWLGSHELLTAQNASAEGFFAAIPFQGFASLKFTLPKDSGQKVALARAVFRQMKPDSNLLVWIRNWMVWPSSAHMPLVVRLRQSLGCERPIEETPGHLFDVNETQDAMSFVILSLEFIWDCLLVDETKHLMCFASHDEYFTLMSRDQPFLAQVGGTLESAKWCRKIE